MNQSSKFCQSYSGARQAPASATAAESACKQQRDAARRQAQKASSAGVHRRKREARARPVTARTCVRVRRELRADTSPGSRPAVARPARHYGEAAQRHLRKPGASCMLASSSSSSDERIQMSSLSGTRTVSSASHPTGYDWDNVLPVPRARSQRAVQCGSRCARYTPAADARVPAEHTGKGDSTGPGSDASGRDECEGGMLSRRAAERLWEDDKDGSCPRASSSWSWPVCVPLHCVVVCWLQQ